MSSNNLLPASEQWDKYLQNDANSQNDTYSQDNTFFDYDAYIPCYNGSNSVIAIKRDGQEIIINKSIKSVINQIIREHSLDIRALRKELSEPKSRLRLLPVPLGPGRVLIPVKVRKAIAVNDGAFAYIELSSIEDVLGDEKTVIMLKSKREISCLESVKTVRKRIRLGDMVCDRFTSRFLGDWDARGGRALPEDSKPATKGDIAMLISVIVKLISTKKT